MTADAAYFARLTLWMLVAGSLVWCLTMAIGIAAARAGPASGRAGRRLVLYGGLVVPALAIVLLLVFGLRPLGGRPASEPDLVVEVTGHMWWWRVRYGNAEAHGADTANELRLPAGRRVELRLKSTDVIHSLWIPRLAAKLDMIPGTTNILYLEPGETGSYPGACAEFCGTAHAQMLFDVVVLEPAAFDAWLERIAAPAAVPDSAAARHGAELFRDNGCGACHTIRGTAADGKVGPDLTHAASRARLGAGVLRTGPANFAHWVAETQALKPGVRMPSYPMLDASEREAIGRFLASLE